MDAPSVAVFAPDAIIRGPNIVRHQNGRHLYWF